MRKILLMAALCMVATLVFAPMALAQGVNLEEDPGDNADPDTGEVFGDDTPDCATADQVLPSGLCDVDSASASASATADPCPDPDFPRETPDGCQASGLPDVSTGSASASASATASASAPTADQYDEDAVVLPETGGPNVAGLALPTLALLVAGGIFAARLVRR